jgi:hypothetical protein
MDFYFFLNFKKKFKKILPLTTGRPSANKTQWATPNKGEENMLRIRMTVLGYFDSRSRCSFRYRVPENCGQD